MPSWLFAETIVRMKEMDYDREVVAIGTVLHDIGLTCPSPRAATGLLPQGTGE